MGVSGVRPWCSRFPESICELTHSVKGGQAHLLAWPGAGGGCLMHGADRVLEVEVGVRDSLPVQLEELARPRLALRAGVVGTVSL